MMDIVETFHTKDGHKTDIWLGNSHVWIGQEQDGDYNEVYFHFDDMENLIAKLKRQPDVQGSKDDETI